MKRLLILATIFLLCVVASAQTIKQTMVDSPGNADSGFRCVPTTSVVNFDRRFDLALKVFDTRNHLQNERECLLAQWFFGEGMKRGASVITGSRYAHAQQPQIKQAHADAPALSDKTKLEIRDEQLAGTRAIAEFQSLQSTIEKAQKRQEELKLAFAASDKKLQSLTRDACGDPKLWALDLDALQCKPAPQPSPTPKSN